MNLLDTLEEVSERLRDAMRYYRRRPPAPEQCAKDFDNWCKRWAGALTGLTKSDRMRALELRVVSALHDEADDLEALSIVQLRMSARKRKALREEADLLRYVAAMVDV
jgi:phosphoserine phosphatase